jgi:hypothetical protein
MNTSGSYHHVLIPADEPSPPPAPKQSSDEDVDPDREIEYAFDADEPIAGRAPSLHRGVHL